jgi:hypothetical protein
MSIVLGGKKFITADDTDFNISRLDIWYKKNPERFVLEATGATLDELKNISRDALLKKIVKQLKLGVTCVQFLGMLHEKIATVYNNIILEWSKKNKDAAKTENFHIVDEKYSANYTPAMTKFKNFRFNSIDTSNIKGFCMMEPVERLKQLLSFPIEKFGEVKLGIVFPDTPKMKVGNVKISNIQDLHIFIHSNKNDITEWHEYYTKLCAAIKEFCQYNF